MSKDYVPLKDPNKCIVVLNLFRDSRFKIEE